MGELRVSECTQERFDWYERLIDEQAAKSAPNVNISPFIKHFSEELLVLCNQFHHARRLRAKWLPHIDKDSDDETDSDDEEEYNNPNFGSDDEQ